MADKTVAQVQAKQSDWMLVELNPDIHVKTPLPPQCHSALRAGFAGYSTNPRWNIAKLQAWRLGRRWRDEMAAGTMVVVDSLLMSQADGEVFQQEKMRVQDEAVQKALPEQEGGFLRSLMAWSRKKTAIG